MSMDIAATGIRAAGMRMAATSHNIANINTPGYKALRAINMEQPTQRGTEVYTTRSEYGADLGQEMIDSLMNLRYLQMNTASFRYSADMTGELINMFA